MNGVVQSNGLIHVAKQLLLANARLRCRDHTLNR
jgi:hypothetical protein